MKKNAVLVKRSQGHARIRHKTRKQMFQILFNKRKYIIIITTTTTIIIIIIITAWRFTRNEMERSSGGTDSSRKGWMVATCSILSEPNNMSVTSWCSPSGSWRVLCGKKEGTRHEKDMKIGTNHPVVFVNKPAAQKIPRPAG